MVSGQCLGNQQSLLLQLKDSLVFDRASSTKLVHWNQSVDCCLWEGVTCNEGRVIGLDLTNESISGGFDSSSSLFSLQYLQHLRLACNNFSSQIPSQFDRLTNLRYLNLSHACFTAQIPIAISHLTRLVTLDLSTSYMDHCVFDSLKLENPNLNMLIQNLSELTKLYLDGVNISAQVSEWGTALSSSLPKLRVLSLSRCHLSGPIPRFNQLQGQLQVFPKYVEYLNFSKNNFNSVIPASIGDSLSEAYFFSLSSNKVYGSIPESICSATNLRVLDLSDNLLSGTIPQCLFNMSDGQMTSNQGLWVLNLSKNNLTGTISNTFPTNCGLQTLSLNGNQLKGKLPKSLARCTFLEVLDIGNNRIEDAFPCYLKNISMLKILILRSNKFYRPIDCRGCNASWPKLQIVDLAANNFTGKLPIKQFSDWKAITNGKNETKSQHNPFRFLTRDRNDIYNLEVLVVVTMKGREEKLVMTKILTIFTSLDFSCNNFEGHILGELGELKLLHILNLSHNAFKGQIPQSLGKLTNLESLDLSSNELTGEIPFQLADGLIFLSVLNLSFNQLVGKIPQIKQFPTFPETSYEGNIGLCGIPLKEKCTREEPGLSSPTSEETHLNSRINAIDWNFLIAELGYVFGFGIIIGPLVFWKRWRICYYKHVDDIFFKMFPQLHIRIENRQRRVHKNQRQRAHQKQGRRH
jgi:Leucine-rich repeat (LRR) protein